MEHERDRPAQPAQPAGNPEESVEQVLAHLYSLPQDEQFSAFQTIAIGALGRLQKPQRKMFVDSLKAALRAQAQVSEPASAGPAESREKVVHDAMRQPFEAQLRLVRTAAPRVVSALPPSDRQRFLDDLSQSIGAIEQGVPVHF